MTVQTAMIRRVMMPTFGLVLAAAAGWYVTAPGAAIQTAQAGIAQPQLRMTPSHYGVQRHGGIPLEALRNAEDRLDSAAVENTHGDPVGSVRSVVVGRGGRPEVVNVAFGGFLGIGATVVPLKADTLGYDPQHKIVLTDMTVPELNVIAQRRDTEAN